MERAGATIEVDKSIVMYHVVLQCDHHAAPSGVAITINPVKIVEANVMAQVVMYKTRSKQCAQQVARFVRRTMLPDSTRTVPVYDGKWSRPVEAMIGYVCMNGLQYPPTRGTTPGFDLAVRMAGMRIQDMLDEVRGGTNAARSRYVVYEVRSRNEPAFRGITNKFHSVERLFREAPPDMLDEPVLAFKGAYATRDEAEKHLVGPRVDYDRFWTKRPHVDYMRRILEVRDRDIVFRSTGESAIREYRPNPTVVIGPHSYTVSHVRHCLELGFWYDGYIRGPSGPQEMLVAPADRHESPPR